MSASRSQHRSDRINITIRIVNRAPNYLFVQGVTLLEPAAFELNEDRGGPAWFVGEDLDSRPKRTGRRFDLDTELPPYSAGEFPSEVLFFWIDGTSALTSRVAIRLSMSSRRTSTVSMSRIFKAIVRSPTT